MNRKKIFSGIVLFSFCLGCALSGQEGIQNSAKWLPTPNEVKKQPLNLLQRAGEKADVLINRIRFKISYSFYKAKEYFRLASYNPIDSLPLHTRDLKSRIGVKTSQMGEQLSGLQDQVKKDTQRKIDHKISELKTGLDHGKNTVNTQLQKVGKEFGKEAQKEFSKQTNGMFR